MPRLRKTSPSQAGWTRRRAGRGFVYLDQDGLRLPEDECERIRALVIPPAWIDVWICPFPNGHLQAVGTDAAGRRQYLYHPDWRVRRDAEKFARARILGKKLPKIRAAVDRDLALDGMPVERACAAAVRLIDLGYFRIGNDAYAAEYGSYGLTTLLREHVRRTNGNLVFNFPGKSGVEHLVEIDDPGAIAVVDALRRRRGGPDSLMAYRNGQGWAPLTSATVNDYVRDVSGLETTAKDFRTWHATVLGAVALAESDEPGETAASRKRAVAATMREVAEYLGNTPAVARSSYVDPGVVDAYEEGVTIGAAAKRKHADPMARQVALERATLRLLSR
jgi:DNA topoisomerase IB